MLFVSFLLFFFGYFWTSYGAHAARRHNPFCVFISSSLTHFFWEGRLWLLTAVAAFKPVKCESERANDLKTFMSRPNLFFRLLFVWLTWIAEKWESRMNEKKMQNMCELVVKLKFMCYSRRLRQVSGRKSFEVIAELSLITGQSAQIAFDKPQIQLLSQISSTKTFIERVEGKRLKWLLMERN